jgi:hypothetical protein
VQVGIPPLQLLDDGVQAQGALLTVRLHQSVVEFVASCGISEEVLLSEVVEASLVHVLVFGGIYVAGG